MPVMNILELRKARGLTQKNLAAAMGVVPSAVSSWEKETALPQARDIPQLADVLGCTIGELFASPVDAPDTGQLSVPHDTLEEE